MNDREQFEAWMPYQLKREPDGDRYKSEEVQFAFESYLAGAESKQSELDKANAEVEHYLSAYRLAYKQAMDNGQARDKANARIAQLEEALNRISGSDDIDGNSAWCDCHEDCQYMANKVLETSSDTWLSEHNKTVEIAVLQKAVAFFETDKSLEWSEHYIASLKKMIESRK